MHWRTPRGSYVDVNSQLALDFAYQEKTICDVSRVFKPSKKYSIVTTCSVHTIKRTETREVKMFFTKQEM